MKLLDKIKDLFMDEVVDDDEIEVDTIEEPPKKTSKLFKEKEKVEPIKEELPPKEEKKYPKVMQDDIKREETILEQTETKKRKQITPEDFMRELEIETKEKEEPTLTSSPKKFSFPIEFSEDEVPKRTPKLEEPPVSKTIVEPQPVRETIKKSEPELYPKREIENEKPKFKATPVISPVYGILDKNYKKDEVKERDDDTTIMKRPSKKVDFETVRKKAFGNLVDDIKDNMLCENCELYKEVKKISSLKEDDLLYDMTVDDSEEITISKAYDNYQEFGVAYEPKRRVHEEEIPEPIPEEEIKDSKPVDNTKFDNLINNIKETSEPVIKYENEEIVTEEKPDIIYHDKIEDEESLEEEPIPRRNSHKEKEETKVDEDFFELIDSMYKERSDE